MKVPLEWLKEHVAIRLSPEALAERLTLAGLEVVGIDDGPHGKVFDLEITPNRADCLSIIGIAREVAAITGQRLKVQGQGTGDRGQADRTRPTSHVPRPIFSIAIEDRQGCRRYIGRLIEGVRVGPSPEWMQRRLLACGARPINNVVDITNYVLFELGQPLHAFDAGRLGGQAIRVRRAAAKERLTTLDGMQRTLTAEMLVIADAQQPVAVAGVMGGVGSEVTQATTRVLLESALFDPVTVRRTARALGLASDSSYRFERGVDPDGVSRASERASALITELTGGREVAVKDAGAAAASRTTIVLEPARAQRWLGVPVAAASARATFARLGCRVAFSGTSGPLRVSPPSYRRDLISDVDLYEELARLMGYDHLPSTLPVAPVAVRGAEERASYTVVQALRRACAGAGLTEVVTWSLVSEAQLSRCRWPAADAARLANPLSQDHAVLQPSLLIGLLQVARHNVGRGTTSVPIFEIGRVTRQGREQVQLGMMISGAWFPDWTAPKQASSFWVLKGLLQAIARVVAGREITMAAVAHPWAAPGESAVVAIGGRAIGSAGSIAPAVLEAHDLKQPAWFAEVSLEALFAMQPPPAAAKPPTEFPPVKRDLSVLLDAQTTYAEVERVIREAAGALADRVELIDRFTGKQVPAGKQSLTVSLDYRDPSKTLTSEEADAAHQRVTQLLGERLGAIRR